MATLSVASDATVPVVLPGTRDCEHRSRARTPHRSRHAEVAPSAPALRQARNRYAASDALASTTEATRQRPSVCLEEPGVRMRHEKPSHPSRDSFRQAVFEDGTLSTPPPQGRRTTLRPSWGRPIATLSVLRRPRSHETCFALLTRYAFTACAKQSRLIRALPHHNFSLRLASFNAAS